MKMKRWESSILMILRWIRWRLISPGTEAKKWLRNFTTYWIWRGITLNVLLDNMGSVDRPPVTNEESSKATIRTKVSRSCLNIQKMALKARIEVPETTIFLTSYNNLIGVWKSNQGLSLNTVWMSQASLNIIWMRSRRVWIRLETVWMRRTNLETIWINFNES